MLTSQNIEDIDYLVKEVAQALSDLNLEVGRIGAGQSSLRHSQNQATVNQVYARAKTLRADFDQKKQALDNYLNNVGL